MRSLVILLVLVVGSVVGCSKSAPAPGKVVSLEQVCNEPDHSRVRLTGYLRYRRGLLSFCSKFGGHETCDLELSATSEAPPDFDLLHARTTPEPLSASLSVPVGEAPGEMAELPDKFKTSDVRVNLANHGVAIDGSSIVVDGTVSVIPSDPKTPNAPKSCFVTVEWAAAK